MCHTPALMYAFKPCVKAPLHGSCAWLPPYRSQWSHPCAVTRQTPAHPACHVFACNPRYSLMCTICGSRDGGRGQSTCGTRGAVIPGRTTRRGNAGCHNSCKGSPAPAACGSAALPKHVLQGTVLPLPTVCPQYAPWQPASTRPGIRSSVLQLASRRRGRMCGYPCVRAADCKRRACRQTTGSATRGDPGQGAPMLMATAPAAPAAAAIVLPRAWRASPTSASCCATWAQTATTAGHGAGRCPASGELTG